MYIACSKGHDKVVQVLLDHGVQVNVQDKVSDISCIHVKWCNTAEGNNATLAIKTQMNVIICSLKC